MRRALLVAAFFLVGLAGPAQAASWEPVGDLVEGGAPSLAVSGGDAYLAVVTDGVLTVRRSGAGGAWTQVGGALNHDPAHRASVPDLVAGGGAVWATWLELGADNRWQARAAKLVAGSWRRAHGRAPAEPHRHRRVELEHRDGGRYAVRRVGRGLAARGGALLGRPVRARGQRAIDA